MTLHVFISNTLHDIWDTFMGKLIWSLWIKRIFYHTIVFFKNVISQWLVCDMVCKHCLNCDGGLSSCAQVLTFIGSFVLAWYLIITCLLKAIVFRSITWWCIYIYILYIYIYIYMYIYVCIYMYIYMCVCVCVFVYIYIYKNYQISTIVYMDMFLSVAYPKLKQLMLSRAYQC